MSVRGWTFTSENHDRDISAGIWSGSSGELTFRMPPRNTPVFLWDISLQTPRYGV
jgi:hypothetical protein